VPCQERERLAAAYLAAVSKTSESSGRTEGFVNDNIEHETVDDEAVLLALYDHQVKHGC
jgi:hypothetical protein